MTGDRCAVLTPERALSAVRGRRFGVPVSMIETATRRREVGDWAGACAAADVDVRIDLDEVGRAHGVAARRALLDDLRRLAPDLLRWHLPRQAHGPGRLRRDLLVPLAEYDGFRLAALTPGAGLDAGERVLLTLLPAAGRLRSAGPAQRRLLAGIRTGSGQRHSLVEHRVFWDAACAPDLRERCGAVPISPGAPAPDRATALQDAGEGPAAWAAAGMRVVPPPDGSARLWRRLGTAPVDLSRLCAHARRAGVDRVALHPGGGVAIVLDGLVRGPVTVTPAPSRAAHGLPVLPAAAWARPLDADLLRFGWLSASALHPLVGAALAPVSSPVPRRWTEGGTAPMTVACGGAVHAVALRDGRWHAVDHPPGGLATEELLVRLGAPAGGCLAALDALCSAPDLVAAVELLIQHGRVDEVAAAVRERLGPGAVPDDVRLPGPGVGVRLDLLRQARLRYRLLLAGVDPDPAPSPPARPGRRTRVARRPRRARKGLAMTHR